MLENKEKNVEKCQTFCSTLPQRILVVFILFGGVFTGDKLVSGIILTNPNLFLPFIPMQQLQPNCYRLYST